MSVTPLAEYGVEPAAIAPLRGRPVRPCMVSFYFDPNYSGSAVQAFNLSRELKRLGVQPLIVSANLSGSPPFEMYHGIPLYRIPVLKPKDLQIPSFWLSLFHFLARRRRAFDIVHAHGTNQHGSASIAGRLFGKPSILKVAMAGNDLSFEGKGRVRGAADRYMVSRFDRYIATTEAILAEFADSGMDALRARLVPNGVDTNAFAPVDAVERGRLRTALQVPDGPLVIYVGIINSRKNVDGALRIWERVVARGCPGHLLLAGPAEVENDPFLATLRAFVRERRLESRVTFLGHRAPIAPYLQVSDAFLFPSRQEGMANSVLEAMACGVPCLVTGEAGVSAVVQHEQNGFALRLDDEAAFADRLAALVTRPDLRARMARSARETIVARYSLQAVARRYLSMYEELMAGVEVGL